MNQLFRCCRCFFAAMLVLVPIACSNAPEAEHKTGEAANAAATPVFDNLGSHRRATSCTGEAQTYFDQGLRLVYAFNHDEAERAFREAARLDANCAIAWWGAAYAVGPNYNLPMGPEQNARALEAVAKAQAVATGPTDAERAYIAAVATRYSADPKADRAALDRTYSDAMKSLAERYPDDNDAAVLYAESLMDLKPWQLWTHDGKPQPGTAEILRVLEGVLARDPNHPGANHYYIHAIEASSTPEKGVASAERLKSLAPGAGHLVHMPAHIFIRTGDYSGAIAANANAARSDEEYFARSKPQGMYPVMYYTHNFQFLATAATMIGQCREAIEAAGKAVGNVAPMAGHEPMAEYVLPWSLYTQARCEKWDDILAQPKPPEATPVTLSMWHYARGLAQAAKADLPAARQERQAMAAAEAKVPADMLLNTNRAHDLLDVAAAVLDGRLASAAGDRNAALAAFRKAVEIQDRLIYDEPPAWYYPVRESLGGELLRRKEYAEAEKVFRRDLQINPNNPRSLFGLGEAQRGQGRNAEAEELRGRFEASWKGGPDLRVSIETL